MGLKGSVINKPVFTCLASQPHGIIMYISIFFNLFSSLSRFPLYHFVVPEVLKCSLIPSITIDRSKRNP